MDKQKQKDQAYDVIVVGGGPAGLSAGIYCVRFGLKTILFDDPGQLSQAALAVTIDDYPGIPGISGPDFVDLLKKHSRDQRLEIRDNEPVRDIQRGADGFRVVTEKGNYDTQMVVLATGAVHKKAGIKGEEEFHGKGVSSCATCDGPIFRGKPVIVVGGGDTAFTYAIFLKTINCDVTLIHRRAEFRAQPVYISEAKRLGIKFVVPHTIKEIVGKQFVEKVILDDEKEIPTSAVFIAVGEAPATELATKLGAKVSEGGFLRIDENRMTAVPGLYAIGDVAEKPLRIISIGVAEGALVAHAIQKAIRARRASK